MNADDGVPAFIVVHSEFPSGGQLHAAAGHQGGTHRSGLHRGLAFLRRLWGGTFHLLICGLICRHKSIREKSEGILDLMGGAHGGGVRCHRDGLIQGGHGDLKGGVPRLVDREIGLISHHHIVIAVAAPHHGGGQSAVLHRQQGRRFHCGPTAAAGQFHLHPVLAVGQGSIRRLTGGLFPGAGGHG